MAALSYAPSYTYPALASPTTGSGTAYGLSPGPVGMPNLPGQLGQVIPNLSGLDQSIFGNLLAQSQGQIPKADQNFMQDQAAGQAAASGMPGTNIMPGTLEGNSAARNLGLLQYQLQNQAAQQYPGLVGAASQTQIVPSGEQIAGQEWGLTNAAAPYGPAAQSYAQKLYNQYLGAARGPGGGTGGAAGPNSGTGTYDPLNLNAGGAGGYTGVLGSIPLGGGSTYVQTGADFNDLFGGGSNPNNLAGVPDQTSIDPNTGVASYDPYGDVGWTGF